MKQRYKTRNSPRRENAIKQAIRHCSDRGWFFGNSHFHEDMGLWIWLLRFKADKHDVLNKLVTVVRNKIVTFCRGDIRPPKLSLASLILLLLTFIVELLELELISTI